MSIDPTPLATAAAGRPLAVPAGDGLLRLALKLDAVVAGANGAAYLALAGPLDDLLGLPASFLRGVGAFLVVYGAVVWAVGTRERLKLGAVTAIIVANTLWVVDSLALVATGWHEPTAAGSVWLVLQAASVALFAGLQVAGRRRAAG